jgi:hypothetical protein
MFSQLTLDTQGRPHIVYLNDFGEDTPKYAWKTDASSTTWGYETVDPNVHLLTNPRPPLAPMSIAVDSANTVHISYYDPIQKSLLYARRSSGLWSYWSVDTVGDLGQYSSIAMNPAGIIGISYYDATNGDLKYANSVLLNLPYSIYVPLVFR